MRSAIVRSQAVIATAMVILFSGIVWAQAKPAQPQGSPAPEPKPGAEILSDTMGVDFGPYLLRRMQIFSGTGRL